MHDIGSNLHAFSLHAGIFFNQLMAWFHSLETAALPMSPHVTETGALPMETGALPW